MKKAFSLIELSIVILIIGILVAGITQSSRLIAQFRLQSARNLTINSPVNSIKDLAVWFETSLESSFISTEAEDGSAISVWNDINPQSSYKRSATQGTTNRKPYFRERIINNALPVVRFFDTNIDATGDRMNFDGNFFVQSNYTIFAVEQRTSSSAGYFFGDESGGSSGVRCGYYLGTNISCVNMSTGILVAVPAYSSPILREHTLQLKDGQLRYWLNGGVTPDASYLSPLVDAITSAANMRIGYHALSGGDFTGDIAEIIIFDRALTTQERQEVEEYLSKKYSLIIS